MGRSTRLERVLSDFGAEESFERASKRVKEHYGIEVCTSTVRTVTLKHAGKMLEEERKRPKVRTLSGKGKKRIIAEEDGSMVPMVQIGTKQKDKRKGRETYWAEARLGAACAHGSLKKHYAVTFGNPDEAGEQWAMIVKEAGWGIESKIHGLGDGAPWIASQCRLQFGNQATYLLDFYHACEHLGAVADACLGKDKQKAWFDKQKERLKKGKIDAVMESLKQLFKPGNVAEKTFNYFDNRRDQLFYKRTLDAQLPIGSGMIESGHRHVLQKRLKLPGAWWLLSNARKMAQLRVLRANELWEHYWGNTMLLQAA